MSSRLPAERRRIQLLDTALEVFAQHGFHVTSMNDVADAAGVTKPVLYQHFSSKRALYLELLDVVGQRLLAAIVAATDVADGPRQQVESGLAAYFRFVAHDRASFRLLFGGGTRRDPEFAETVTQVENAIAAVIAELIEVPGLRPVARGFLAHGIVGLAEGTGRHWLAADLEDELDPETAAAAVADLAWRGLRGLRGDLV